MENIKNIFDRYVKNDFAARKGNLYGDYGQCLGFGTIGFDYFKDDEEKIETNDAIENLFERVMELEWLVIKLNDELNGEKKNTN